MMRKMTSKTTRIEVSSLWTGRADVTKSSIADMVSLCVIANKERERDFLIWENEFRFFLRFRNREFYALFGRAVPVVTLLHVA